MRGLDIPRLRDVVALVGETATAFDWHDDAVQHVANATGSKRDDLWFCGTSDGCLIFNGPFGQPQQPIGWITNPYWFQRAKSRGDLEDVDSFF